jgi:hypoxanthine-guanine phosphoribosyltransferase
LGSDQIITSLMGYLHYPADVSENCAVRHDTNFFCVVSYDRSVHLSDCVNWPLSFEQKQRRLLIVDTWYKNYTEIRSFAVQLSMLYKVVHRL